MCPTEEVSPSQLVEVSLVLTEIGGLCVRPLCHCRPELGSGSGFSDDDGSDPPGLRRVIETIFSTSKRLIANESGDHP